MKKNKQKLVGIVGFGYIGSVIAASLKNCDIIAFEKNPKTVSSYLGVDDPTREPYVFREIQKKINDKSLIFSTDFADISNLDVIIITIGTPVKKNGEYDLHGINLFVTELERFSKPEQLIILKSTVTPGTTRQCFASLLEKNFNLQICFCPERIAEGTAIEDLKSNPVLISGFDNKSTKLGAEFLEDHLGVSCKVMTSVEEAELLKLATNAWIDLNIAFANELARLCSVYNIDMMNLVEHANTLKKGDSYVNILRPSVGVGGTCLTKDPIALYTNAEKKNIHLNLTKLARKINSEAHEHHISILHRELQKMGLKPIETKIAVLGVSFKSNVADTRNSPAFDFISGFQTLGYQVEAYDPLVRNSSFARDIELNDSLSLTINNASVVAFLCGHDDFNTISPEIIKCQSKPECIIFDGRMYFSLINANLFTEAGFKFIGPCYNSLAEIQSTDPDGMFH